MRGLLLITGILAIIITLLCQSLQKIPVAGNVSIVKTISHYSFVIYPVAVFLLAYVFSGNLVVSLLASIIVALVFNWGVVFG